jgi:bifunctional non-homologous end joining protein LigD
VKGSLAEATELARTLGQLGVLARSDHDADAPLTRVEGPLPARNLSPPADLTNPDKVLYPRDGLRKLDVAAYYRDVAPVLLPLLRERPVVCQRWPDGIDDFTWYQHRMPPKAPDYLRSVWIDVVEDAADPRFVSRAERAAREDKARRRAALDPEPARPAGPRRDRRIVIDETEGLLYMVNQAALTFHGWASRVGTLDEPDWAIFDLDPPEGAPFSSLVEIAEALRKLLEMLGLESHPKTSGQKGLHVLVPLGPGHTIDTVQRFAEGVARVVAHTLPTRVTLETERDKRGGRVYLDHGQTFRGKTLVMPYSLRAVDGAPASTPLRWDELGPRLDPRAFTLRTLRARLDRVGDLAAALLDGRQALGPALAKLP